MTYTVGTLAGAQPIALNSTVQKHPLGTVTNGWDPTYGEGEFIYLLGVGSTVVGSLVKYSASTWQTVLTTNQQFRGEPVAVAMAATVASEYGWYQIGGNAVIKKTAAAVAPQVALFLSSSAGRVKSLTSSGMQVLGARSANLATVTSTTSTVIVTLDRPHLQGQIT